MINCTLPVRLVTGLCSLFLILLLSTRPVYAQNPAPQTSYVFNTQSDVDAFVNANGKYTSVKGSLTISASGTITDLSNFSDLVTIGGALGFRNYGLDETNRDPLSAFTSLTKVFKLNVIGTEPGWNQGISRVTSSSLHTITSELNVLDSRAVTVVNLPAVTTVEDIINFSDLDALTSVSLPLVAGHTSNIILVRLPQLTSFSLPEVTGTGQLRLSDLLSLPNLDGFAKLATCSYFLEIERNTSLTSITGLGASAGGLTGTFEYFSIVGNPLITSIGSIGGQVNGDFALNGNTALTDAGSKLEFVACQILEISSNPALTSIAGLLKGSGDLNVDYFVLADNESLTELNFRPLVVGYAIYIYFNTSLPVLPNFGQMTSMGSTSGGFGGQTIEIVGNPALTDMGSLSNLSTLSGDLRILDNDALQDLTGLFSLQQVATLEISGNDQLTNLDGLFSLTTIDRNLKVSDNAALAQCCQLTCGPTVAGQPVSDSNFNVYIAGNTGDCETSATLDESDCSAACSSSAVAPITLTSFRAERAGDKNLISWVTSAEVNNDFFVVERSTTGLNFTQVGRVKGAGQSSKDLTYSLTERAFDAPTVYYRLTQVDFGGTSTRSDVVMVSDSPDVLRPIVYPNPARSGEAVTVQVDGDAFGADFRVLVYAASGVLCTETTATGHERVVLDGLNLMPGIYTVQLIQSDRTTSRRLVVN